GGGAAGRAPSGRRRHARRSRPSRSSPPPARRASRRRPRRPRVRRPAPAGRAPLRAPASHPGSRAAPHRPRSRRSDSARFVTTQWSLDLPSTGGLARRGVMPRPRDRALRSAGVRLHLLDWGTVGLPPILLLHGAAQTAHSFDEVAPALAPDPHAIALYQRGH